MTKKTDPKQAVELIRQWKADAQLRVEFGNFGRYVAYMENKRV